MLYVYARIAHMIRYQRGCKKSGCVIHKAETILEKDIYGGKSNGG